VLWVSVLLSATIVIWFYGVVPSFGASGELSAFRWIWGCWNEEYYDVHGVLFPFVIGGLIIYRLKDLRAAADACSRWSLLVVFLGVLFYFCAYRLSSPRLALSGLPLILWGSVWFLWGLRVARILAFPFFFFMLAIPSPSFQKMTIYPYLLMTSLAHHGCSLFGIETVIEGTRLLSTKVLGIDMLKGCSHSIPSLMPLLMISATWAYVARISIWKKALLLLSAFPLAILGNALRIVSIFVVAEYGDERWAKTDWYHWSRFLLVYPFCLISLLLIYSILVGRLPWKRANPLRV
jgi:exosortase